MDKHTQQLIEKIRRLHGTTTANAMASLLAVRTFTFRKEERRKNESPPDSDHIGRRIVKPYDNTFGRRSTANHRRSNDNDTRRQNAKAGRRFFTSDRRNEFDQLITDEEKEK